jgi:OFA family oxalate/formate antiporter-like MFS transporter
LIGSISRYFPDQRVFAIGILTSGLTMGSTVMPPVIARLVVAYGWRSCFLILAVMLFVSSAPAILLLGKEAPLRTIEQVGLDRQGDGGKSRTGQRPSLRGWNATEAVKTFPFFLIVTLGFVTGVGFYLMAAHMVAYATDMGIATTSAALILSSQSIGNIVGKVSIWSVTDRIGTRLTMVLVLSLQALCVTLLVWPNTLWPLCILSAMYGYGLGSSMALRMSIIPEYFGTAAVGTLVGISGVFWGIGGIAGPVLAGKIFDVTRSYHAAFISGGLTLSSGIIAACFLKPPMHRD